MCLFLTLNELHVFILIQIMYISPSFVLLFTTGVSANHWSRRCGVFRHSLDSDSCSSSVDQLPVSTALLPADITRRQAD